MPDLDVGDEEVHPAVERLEGTPRGVGQRRRDHDAGNRALVASRTTREERLSGAERWGRRGVVLLAILCAVLSMLVAGSGKGMSAVVIGAVVVGVVVLWWGVVQRGVG